MRPLRARVTLAKRPTHEPIQHRNFAWFINATRKQRIAAVLLTKPVAATWKQSIEADYQMKDGMLVLDMRVPLIGYALRRWAVDCTPDHTLDPRSHHLSLGNPQTLYGVESATLAPGYVGD